MDSENIGKIKLQPVMSSESLMSAEVLHNVLDRYNGRSRLRQSQTFIK